MRANYFAILLCTFNGEEFIEKQLKSIEGQTHRKWHVYVSDDGSNDSTLAILERYKDHWGAERMTIYSGPGLGFSKNFMSLIQRPEISANYYAFVDQDDEWLPTKLERALGLIQAEESKALKPVLYGSRTTTIDKHGEQIGESNLYQKKPSFENALVQNIVTGNTMILNHSAISLFKSLHGEISVSAHDWLAYLLVTGNGGVMIYDPLATTKYRQHSSNLYGSNVSFRARLIRFKKLCLGDFREWNEKNCCVLARNTHLLKQDELDKFYVFQKLRNASFFQRLYLFYQSGIYRQTTEGQVGMWIAVFMNRM